MLIDVKLTVYYHGIKATQYFSKSSPESISVLLEDLVALKLPHPKRANISLISFGRMECVWPSVERNSVLHYHVGSRVDPYENLRPETERVLEQLSIANITAKFRDLEGRYSDNVSFKRVDERAVDPRPWKRAKIDHEPKNAYQPKNKPTLDAFFDLPWAPKHSWRAAKTAQETSNPSRDSRQSLKRPRPEEYEDTSTNSRLDAVKPPEPLPTKPPLAMAPPSSLPPLPSSVPPRPDTSLPTPPSSSSTTADSQPKRMSRFGLAPIPPTRYSPHTLAAFAKEYTKPEPVSPPMPPAALPPIQQPSTAKKPAPIADPASSTDRSSREEVARTDRRVPDEPLRAWRLHPEDSSTRDRRDDRDARLAPRTTSMNGRDNVRDGEKRDYSLAASSRRMNIENGNAGATSSKMLESALAETRGRLAKLEAELAEEKRRRRAAEDATVEERRKRRTAEDAISDIRRECRAPFVVPSLLDAFMELSRITTIATTAAPSDHGIRAAQSWNDSSRSASRVMQAATKSTASITHMHPRRHDLLRGHGSHSSSSSSAAGAQMPQKTASSGTTRMMNGGSGHHGHAPRVSVQSLHVEQRPPSSMSVSSSSLTPSRANGGQGHGVWGNQWVQSASSALAQASSPPIRVKEEPRD
ncbi:hypothetical protein BDN70DRAFT_879115 [Pholiota conissans]|uniref:Uncharacterized protein n=1 Tax=Pholiota conissans TaxID=109636 RepID=A0A9P5Z3E7_9AGAR|nr:hypothetical protein BDN70DRAFT_879115 [Pholiota conissans]